MDSESLRIIETYFKDVELIPLVDPLCYESMPSSFWIDLGKTIELYRIKRHVPEVFDSLFSLAKTKTSTQTIFDFLFHPEQFDLPPEFNAEYFREIFTFSEADNEIAKSGKASDLIDLISLKFGKMVTIEEITENNYEGLFKLSARIQNGDEVADDFFQILKNHPEFYSGVFSWMSEALKIYLKSVKFGKRAARDVGRVNARYNWFKRTELRKAYKEYDDKISKKFYEENPVCLDYPNPMMLDRIAVFVYSTDLMSYMGDVKDAIENSKVSSEIVTEQLMYDKIQMQEEGYSEEEIESLLPDDLDLRFSFMETRSILSGFKLQRKPKEYRDGSGSMLLWHTDGATYRYRHNPPKGAPISLAGFYNMQRLVYNMLLQDHPEIEKAYNEEFIEESNFIPFGYEIEYLKYEKQVMEDLKEKTVEFFIDMTRDKLKINPVDFVDGIKISISQIEVCWNQELPFDAFGYLHDKMGFYVRDGLTHTALHGETPLMVSKIYSDIEPNAVRFSFKNYKKSKRILRNEIVLGNELKTQGLDGNETLSDMFFRDVDEAKRFVYSKFILQVLRKTEGVDEEEYRHGYNRFIRQKTDDYEWKKRVLWSLVAQSGIEKEFQNIDVFDLFAEQINNVGYVKKSFFLVPDTKTISETCHGV
jgi:hypothetical protein